MLRHGVGCLKGGTVVAFAGRCLRGADCNELWGAGVSPIEFLLAA